MKVKLTYFKLTGKFYSEGEYVSTKKFMHEIFEEVKNLLNDGNLPGLIQGSHNFIVYVDVPEHQHNHPALIMPLPVRDLMTLHES